MKKSVSKITKPARHMTPKPRTPKIKMETLPTGVRGLDLILGGGLPSMSFNIIAGMPGGGKTTLAHQIMFTNATAQKPGLYFTVLGEPGLKMMRHQQQFGFYEGKAIGKAVRIINLGDMLLEKGANVVLAEIITQVTTLQPGIVVVDSFRSLARNTVATSGELELQTFILRLSQFLASWEATTILVGEYAEDEIRGNPMFTMVDGIIWLSQVVERNSVVRKLQVMKMRGHASVPGLHTFRIMGEGMQVFSRTLVLPTEWPRAKTRRLLSMGNPALDLMMGGGLPAGDSLLVAGPSGTGKSAISTQFIAAGLSCGEPGVIVIFEERPEGYTRRADALGMNLDAGHRNGTLETLYLRPLDLSVDETMQEILDAIQRVGAKRLVIDSLVGFEMALAPGFRIDFRESLYRMIAALTGTGITILSTVEVEDNFTSLQFSHYAISFLTDDIIRLRYAEIDGQLRKLIVVIKMRGGNHSKDIREYVINDEGLKIINPQRTQYTGLTTGLPTRTGPRAAQESEAAPEPKAIL